MTTGILTLDDLAELVAQGGIDTVLVAIIDMQGRLMGKRFQAEFFLESGWRETHGCDYLLATDLEMEAVPGYKSSGWATGYGDITLRPDLSTLRRLPWLPGTALVLCDAQDHRTHADVPHSPRALLKRQIARLEAMGLRPMMASELEFFLFTDSYADLHGAGYRDLTPLGPYNQDYHIFQTSKEEDVMRAIRTGLNAAGIPVESSKGEASAGQEEINLRYDDALRAADAHAIVKTGCKDIAFQKGKALTFLAKWNNRAAGSSSHVHQSLWTLDGEPAFFDPAAPRGMSDLMRHFLAGQLEHAGAITYFLAPYINSYKRFVAGTFAPTKAIWSTDNRTAGYRLCGEGTKAVRVECRVGGSDLTPHLAYAALLAAGIDGIERRLELEPEFHGDAYSSAAREIPKTLRAAIQTLDGSTMLRAAFGDGVVDHYLHAARWEQAEHDRHVTDWEIARGFERA